MPCLEVDLWATIRNYRREYGTDRNSHLVGKSKSTYSNTKVFSGLKKEQKCSVT